MNSSAERVLSELALALDSELSLIRSGKGEFEVTDNATLRSWTLPYTADDLASFAARRDASAVEVGVGTQAGAGGVSPGVALLAIHMSEAVATAGAATDRLVVDDGGVSAVKSSR